jgi:hypothetical protein
LYPFLGGATDISCFQFVQSLFLTSSERGPPRVRPWRTPPSTSTLSFSIFCRALRP